MKTTTTSERLQSLDPAECERFMHWRDWTGRESDDIGKALDEWREADWGEFPTLGAWLKAHFFELEPEAYNVMDERGLLDFLDFEDLAQYRYRYDFTLLDGHVYQDNI